VFKPAELAKLDLVIVGGESGEQKVDVRPMNPDWVRSIRDQCKACSGVRFNFKQWGGWAPDRKHAEKDLSNAAVFLKSTPDVPIILESDEFS
jgi:protein gp37